MNNWIYDDGGRERMGLVRLKSTGDCVPRAISISSGLSYIDAFEIVNRFCQREKNRVSYANIGVRKKTLDKIMKHLGYQWINKRFKWDGRTMVGNYVFNLSDHVVAYIDGKFHDIYKSVPAGRIVYGYWKK
jgi:hypothetical protein